MNASRTVLHVITGLSTGGAERALYNLLAAGGAGEPVVLSLLDAGTHGAGIRELGIPVYELRMRPWLPGPLASARLWRVVREAKPQVVQGWMYHGNLAATLAARFARSRPAVVWNVRHSLYDLSWEKPMTRQVIRANRGLSHRADAIIYNSQISRQQHESFGFAGGNGLVIPNGFDIDALQPPETETRRSARAALGLPAQGVVVGHVARFHPMKDHVGFLRVAVQVARQEPEAIFLLLGRDVHLENPRLAGIVPDELRPRFFFLGERDDVPRCMAAMDVLCTSSAWGEAFPNVLGEAMAMGIPCIATDVGDSGEIVATTGRVVPPMDPESLAQALSDMLRMPASERSSLGQSARGRIQSNYGLPEIVDKYANLYESMAEG